MNTPLKFAVDTAVSLAAPIVSASCVVSSTPVSLAAATVRLGPSSANWMLPPRSTVWLDVAVSPSKSVIVADAVRLTRLVASTASWSSNGAPEGTSAAWSICANCVSVTAPEPSTAIENTTDASVAVPAPPPWSSPQSPRPHRTG